MLTQLMTLPQLISSWPLILPPFLTPAQQQQVSTQLVCPCQGQGSLQLPQHNGKQQGLQVLHVTLQCVALRQLLGCSSCCCCYGSTCLLAHVPSVALSVCALLLLLL